MKVRSVSKRDSTMVIVLVTESGPAESWVASQRSRVWGMNSWNSTTQADARDRARRRARTAGDPPQYRVEASTSACSGLGCGASGSTRQWYSRGKAAVCPVSTHAVVMALAATSRQAPKPGEPTPYWQNAGSPKRLAVDISCCGSRSRAVSGICLAKTGVSAISSITDVPPIPDPRTRAGRSSSATSRSRRAANADETFSYLLVRLIRSAEGFAEGSGVTGRAR